MTDKPLSQVRDFIAQFFSNGEGQTVVLEDDVRLLTARDAQWKARLLQLKMQQYTSSDDFVYLAVKKIDWDKLLAELK